MVEGYLNQQAASNTRLQQQKPRPTLQHFHDLQTLLTLHPRSNLSGNS